MNRNRLSQDTHPFLTEHLSDNLQKINRNLKPLSLRCNIYPISSAPIMAKTLSTSRATAKTGVRSAKANRSLHLRFLLSEQITTLQRNIDRSIQHMRKGREALPDTYDVAALASDSELEVTIRERDTRQVRDLQEAMARIAQGRYGICEVCESRISEKRLNANPVTTLCISCQEAKERTVRRSGSIAEEGQESTNEK
jgi:DnaK suppressor protein